MCCSGSRSHSSDGQCRSSWPRSSPSLVIASCAVRPPPLKPESPWFGYSLGEWPEELELAAERAVQGDYFETGEALVKRRRKDVAMNTEVRDVDPGQGGKKRS